MIDGQSEEIRQVVQAIFTATPEPKAVPPVGTKEWEIFAQEFCDDLFAEESPPSEAYEAMDRKLAAGTAKIKFDAEGCFTVE